MNSPTLPRLHLVPESQLGSDSYHSILISALRALAALQVAAAHLRAEFFPGLRGLDNPALWYQALAFFSGFAHQAVLVFFLISGWLVGGSLLNKLGQPEALTLYAIDRVTRLWTVLMPTFVLILAFGILNGTLDPRTPDFSASNPYSWVTLAGNLVGLQNVSVPEFGDNYPLWSLANESWYYLMFPVLVLGLKSRGGARALALGFLLATALLLPTHISVYFLIWLMGAAASRLRLDCGAGTRLALLSALALLSVVFRLKGSNDDLSLASFPQDLALSVLFLLFLCSTVVKTDPASRLTNRARRLANLFSDFSFTLYVVHIPVLGMLGWLGLQFYGSRQLDPHALSSLVIYGAMLAAVVLFAYGFYRLFEARTYQVRRWCKALLTSAPLPNRRSAPAERG
jgi:peptidoglycan/LPS O-acetylase OafA/YrhL